MVRLILPLSIWGSLHTSQNLPSFGYCSLDDWSVMILYASGITCMRNMQLFQATNTLRKVRLECIGRDAKVDTLHALVNMGNILSVVVTVIGLK